MIKAQQILGPKGPHIWQSNLPCGIPLSYVASRQPRGQQPYWARSDLEGPPPAVETPH
ncbi:UNVERIFIED_CONTAM: hypothetical protein Sindi_1650100, partial [Sesamum indicum]